MVDYPSDAETEAGYSIASRTRETLTSFGEVISLQEPGSERQNELEDSQSRFRVWAGNIGALASGRSSLDVRLGNSRVANEVRALLDELKETLTFLVETSSEIDANQSTDDGLFEDLLEAVTMTITNLMKTSASIRQNPERDPWKRIMSLPPWFSGPMVDNVIQRYPKLENVEWLTKRLGLANSRRRQFFQYREEHVAKLAKPLQNDDQTVSETIPTTFQGDKVKPQVLEAVIDDAVSDTTFATAFEPDTDAVMTIPPPPEGHEKHDVECPLCRHIVSVKTRHSWKKHVYRDLRPYVCTFMECDLRVFDKRRDWQTHEIEDHRAHAICPLCSEVLAGKYKLASHIQNAHGQAHSDHEIKLLSSSARMTYPILTASMCPFCDEWNTKETQRIKPLPGSETRFLENSPKMSLKQFGAHVGRHMEQLSLFSLPRTYEDVEGSPSDAKGSSSNSTEFCSIEMDGKDVLDTKDGTNGVETLPLLAMNDAPGGHQAPQPPPVVILQPARTPKPPRWLEKGIQAMHDEFPADSFSYSLDPTSMDQSQEWRLYCWACPAVDSVHETGAGFEAFRTHLRSHERTMNRQYPGQEQQQQLKQSKQPTMSVFDKEESIPPGARRTKIDRSLVDTEALIQSGEEFEERTDTVIMDRVLKREEVQDLADKTEDIRDARYHESIRVSEDLSDEFGNSASHQQSQLSTQADSASFDTEPVYPKIHKDDIEEETLREYELEWEDDTKDKDYLVILEELTVQQTDMLFAHTKRLRKRSKIERASRLPPPPSWDRSEFPFVRRRRSRSSNRLEIAQKSAALRKSEEGLPPAEASDDSSIEERRVSGDQSLPIIVPRRSKSVDQLAWKSHDAKHLHERSMRTTK